MPKYDVTIPFEEIRYETINSSQITRLPEAFQVGSIMVARKEDDLYQAHLAVEAPAIGAAKTAAVDKVREILSLMATWNEGFRIRFGAGLDATRQPGNESPTVEYHDGGASVHIKNTIEFSDSMSLLKTRGSMQFEVEAVAWRDSWPDWLSIALELNYLAVTSHESKPAFVVHYSALEVLVAALEGEPPLF